MRIAFSIAICLLLDACAAPVRTPIPIQAAAIDYYRHSHAELDIQKGSRAWNELPESEKADHEDEEGMFAETADVLLLQSRTKGTIAFCVSHVGPFLHECMLSGIATRSANGDYEYREMLKDLADNPIECVLTIHRTALKIGISDENTVDGYGNCKSYCGAHASFGDGIEFKASEQLHDPDAIADAIENSGECKLPK